MRYTIATYNFNGYERFYDIPDNIVDNDAEYIYFTDDRTLKSDKWHFVYMDCDADPFYTICKIRYNIFDYVNTDIVMMFDGSMRPTKNLKPIIDMFENGGYDFASIIHPTRNTLYDELCAWVRQRGMPLDNANKALEYFWSNGYDVANYRGLFQINLMVMRKTEDVINMQKDTLRICEELAEEGKNAFRCDQVVLSYVTNRAGINTMPIGQYICGGMFFNWYAHGTDTPMYINNGEQITPYLFDKSVYLAPLW